ncbi:MAG TPA: carbohydrate binding domain-containing protein, partial [bacterium]|nr:carbohydrate binding domain-containing protein [bacterium]
MTNSPTPAPPTNTPTVTATFTNSPFVTATNTPAGSPTPTPTPTSAMIDDFEGGAGRDQTLDNWGDPVDMVADASSTIFAQPANSSAWVANSGSTPGFTGTYCAHVTGNLAGNPASAYAYFAVELNSAGYTTDTDISTYTGFSFNFKAGVAGVLYSVGLIQTAVSGSASPTALYQYQFRPVDTAWHTITCYFPPATNPYPPSGWCITQLAQPPYAWVSPVAFSKNAGAIQFSPVVQTSAVAFDMSVDNIQLVKTAEPTPPALDTNYSSIDYFDDETANNSKVDPAGPFAGAEVYTGQGGASSTMSSPPNNLSNIWPNNWYTPGNCPLSVDPMMTAANSCGTCTPAYNEFTGTVDPAGWAIWQFAYVSGGYPYSAVTPIVLPGTYAPNGRLVFDAKTTVPATLYQVQFETQYTGPGTGPGNPSGLNNYNFYSYQFNLTTSWTCYSVFLPTAP